nr:hypothetical protein OG409_28480 [Streptomyces sp. NBC_00974]
MPLHTDSSPPAHLRARAADHRRLTTTTAIMTMTMTTTRENG